MKTSMTKKLATVIACLCLASQAIAISITPSTLPQWTGNDTSQSVINSIVAGITGSATELYKDNVGDASNPNPDDVGTLATSYTTVFSNSALDPADALITYDGGPVVGPTAWLLVKDGNQTPAWYLFNLTGIGWTGVEDLVLTGFWPQQGAISHVTLYGTRGTTNTPDGGSMLALLGGAVAMLGFVRRKIA